MKLGLACLTAGFALSVFATAPLVVVGQPAATNPPAVRPPTAAADTNFIDPALLGGDNPQVAQLTEELKKEGVKPESFMDQHFLWASLLWGSVATGYLIYAKRQREFIPFLGGAGMFAASCLVTAWFWMSVVCIVLIIATHWMIRHTD